MPIKSKPKTRWIEVPLTGTNAVVLLELRAPTNQEHVRHMSRVNQPGDKRKSRESVWQARMDFIDLLLEDIAARNEEGEPDYVSWHNPETGKDERLGPLVPNWKDQVESSWKCAAALALEGVVGGMAQDWEDEDGGRDPDPLDS